MGDVYEGFDLLFTGDKPRSTKRVKDEIHYLFGDVSNIIAEYVGVCVPSNLSLDTLCTEKDEYLCYKDFLDIEMPILSNDNKMCMEDIIHVLTDKFSVGFRLNSVYNFVDIDVTITFILDNIQNSGYDKFTMLFVRPKTVVDRKKNHQFIIYNYANLNYDIMQSVCGSWYENKSNREIEFPHMGVENIKMNTKLSCIIYKMLCNKFKNINKEDIIFRISKYQESKRRMHNPRSGYYIAIESMLNISDDDSTYPLDNYITKLLRLIDNTKNYTSYELVRHGNFTYKEHTLPIFY
jgi:hypothetical protein